MRVLLRVLSPLLGLVLAAAGVLLIVEVVAAMVRPNATEGLLVPWVSWRSGVEGLTWADSAVTGIAIGVGVLGLLLILIGFAGRRHDVALQAPSDGVTVTTSPRVLARLVGRRVRAADGVAGATVTATDRKVAVAAQGWGEPDPALRGTLRQQVDAFLGELPLARRPRVSVSVQDRKGS